MGLRELALAATPGPWEYVLDEGDEDGCIRTIATFPHEGYGGTTHHWQSRVVYGVWHNDSTAGVGFGKEPDDAAYLAAVDPQTVLALLDRIEELELAVRYGLDP